VLADEQVLRCRMVLVVLRLRRVVRAPFDDFLDVFRFDVDRHGANDASMRWTRRRLEANWTRVRHSHVKLPEHVGVLQEIDNGHA
jgi:hypothetical protein